MSACKALAAGGHLPITYDNLSRGNTWAVKWGPFEKGTESPDKVGGGETEPPPHKK